MQCEQFIAHSFPLLHFVSCACAVVKKSELIFRHTELGGLLRCLGHLKKGHPVEDLRTHTYPRQILRWWNINKLKRDTHKCGESQSQYCCIRGCKYVVESDRARGRVVDVEWSKLEFEMKSPILLFRHHRGGQGSGKYIQYHFYWFSRCSTLRAGESVIWKSMAHAVWRTTAPYARGTMPLGIPKICPKKTRSLVSGVRCALTMLDAPGKATLSREGNWTIPDCQGTLGTFRHTPRDVMLHHTRHETFKTIGSKHHWFNGTKILKGAE